jgi:hypothetical protein
MPAFMLALLFVAARLLCAEANSLRGLEARLERRLTTSAQLDNAKRLL